MTALTMMRHGLLMLFFLGLLLPSWSDAACTGARPALSCTGDKVTLQAAFTDGGTYGARQEGETINVIAGSWTWGGLAIDWTVSKPSFILKGAGIGQTIFIDDTTNAGGGVINGMLVADLKNAAAGLVTFRDFTIDANNVNRLGAYLNLTGQGLNKFRVTNVELKNIGGTAAQSSRGFATWGNSAGTTGVEFTGLFDHVTCQKATSATDCFVVYGSWNNSNGANFQWPKSLGTNHATYIEDSTCTFDTATDDCTDGKNGAGIVFRYNTLNYGFGQHGPDSSFRGNRQTEVYRNTFTAPPTTGHSGINFRGGGDIAFDNSFHANYPNLQHVIYRTASVFGTFGETPARGKCDGTSTWDGNQGAGTPADVVAGVGAIGNPDPTKPPGWPCLDQIGWFFQSAGATGATAQQIPAYYWRNTYTASGTNLPFSFNDQLSNDGINNNDTWTTNYIVPNRDYYTDGGANCTGGGTCTDGVGVDTTLPVTCTVGTGFWKTNDGNWNRSGDGRGSGRLYKCTSPDTWTLYYTPYIYPHPLQGATPAPFPPCPVLGSCVLKSTRKDMS